MARVNHIQTNFTGGEVSPRMKGRVDVSRYQNGAEVLENVIVYVHGGANRRAGLRYCAEAKHAGDRVSYLLPYVFSREQAYVLEFGHEYVRVFDVDGGALVDEADALIEIVSPYTEDQLAQVKITQGGDTLLLFHPDVPTYRLRRQSATVWTMQTVPWVAEPFAEIGHQPDAKLGIDNPAVGAGRTFTTSAVVVPGAPINVVATPLNGAARVAFDPPAADGGAEITSYTVTSSPGGLTKTGTGSPLVVLGLTNGVAYTFTVTASNKAGASVASAASAAVTPLASLASPAITAVATPASFYMQVPNGQRLGLSGPLGSSPDGAAPLTHHWEKVSGSAAIIITGDSTAAPTFKSTGYGTTNYAVFRDTITDALGSQGTVDVPISIEHETGRDGPGVTIEP